MSFSIISDSEAATSEIGRRLAACLPNGVTIGLNGTLGAGKTRLVQAIGAACGVAEGTVVSPTFTLCNEYRGDRAIYHLDLYRIQDEDEWIELGIEEYFGAEGLTLIEWSNRFQHLLPDDRIDIEMDVVDVERREIQFATPSKDLMSRIKDAFAGWSTR